VLVISNPQKVVSSLENPRPPFKVRKVGGRKKIPETKSSCDFSQSERLQGRSPNLQLPLRCQRRAKTFIKKRERERRKTEEITKATEPKGAENSWCLPRGKGRRAKRKGESRWARRV